MLQPTEPASVPWAATRLRPQAAATTQLQSLGFIAVGLEARDKLPTVYYSRHFVSDGGL
jgi:hypothetical protein